jgi:isopenicillin N synthase-like dioxygenase
MRFHQTDAFLSNMCHDGSQNVEIAHFDWTGRVSPAELGESARRAGCFYVSHPLFPVSRCDEALQDARAFFGLPSEEKRNLAIERSPHFRGYSEMHNERDWREQIHFGREEPACGSDPPYLRLRGPNLWPGDAEWRSRLLRLLDDLERVGREVLTALGVNLEPDEAPYLLLKLIHYQTARGGVPRSGVAPHVDFSWITLLLQDDTGGLEARTPDGIWLDVRPVPGALVVNIGEILQFASGGHYLATPHRVVSRASRVSMPFFLNPGLDMRIEGHRSGDLCHGEHVHRVLTGPEDAPFVFGEAEWKRKGLGVWCGECVK